MITLQQVQAQDNVTTSVNRKHGILYQKWEGTVVLTDFHSAADTAQEYFRRYNCKYFIADTKLLGPLFNNDLTYAAKKLKAFTGLKLFICIEPLDHRAHFSLEKLSRKLDGVLTLYMAETMNSALEFIYNHKVRDLEQLSLF